MEKEMLLYNPWCKYKMASKKHPTQNQDQWYKEKKKTTQEIRYQTNSKAVVNM